MDKDHGMKCDRNQAVSSDFLPVESHEAHEFLQQQIVVSYIKCSLPETCLEIQSVEFFIGKGPHSCPLSQMLSALQTSRRKAGIQDKPHCLHSFGIVTSSH